MNDLSRKRAVERRSGSDAGFTLVELMAYIFLFSILAVMVATLVINGMRSQAEVTGTTNTTGEMQNAAAALEYDIRYASDIQISVGGQMLRTRTWYGEPDTGAYQCRGWFYDSADRKLKRSTSQAEVVSATATSASGWTTFASNVEATRAFHQEPNSKTVDIRMEGDPAQWGIGTRIYTSVTNRPQSDEGGMTCF
ncbi:prepilin-type N-terminal cleavage/methylation domain-containing protein [Demequina sp. B12]|uniref:PulJ/GspJ family protein n=1 Tax=Demequina sp. B12 TaxID=2992757 RepID=UPI00237BC147|nr:prepilin-type N-terminal cleavage/methylation domain-containing protein [Demequina sp. B12]MDE0573044.1 prepilin-type N-terminal cleavage/methylation domain-containing protein [Demequina sp. B12]